MSLIPKASHLRVPHEVILEATENFKTPIGRGGYGYVYRGQLSVSGKITMVAVKKLDHNLRQGNREFLTEIHLLSRYTNQHLVSLVGFCDEGEERFLIYEYAKHGSLDKYLKPNRCPFTWKKRINICIDAARGLDHLHNHLPRNERVLHRDIKSANILLDHNWKAMIADLGLSIIGRANESTTFLITDPCGTRGYCDPAYARTCVLTKESDVYSFGVVLLEVLCGRGPIIVENGKEELLVTRAKRYYYEQQHLNHIIDHQLKNHVNSASMKHFSKIAIDCLQDERTDRPSMGSVLRKLERALTLLEIEEAHELVELEEALDLQELVETLQMQDFEEACDTRELQVALGVHVTSNLVQKPVETLQMQQLEEASGLRVVHEPLETLQPQIADEDRIEQPNENRLPNDYKQFIYYSNQEMMKKPQGDVIFPTEEEAYSILSRGVLIKLNNEVNMWFWITKLKGKKCFVLPPKLLHYGNQLHKIERIPSEESRTRNVLHLSPSEVTMHFDVPTALFSQTTTYGCFLVYKILQHFDGLTLMETKLNDNLQLGKCRVHLDISESPINEFKPIKREDGWLEVNLVNKSDNIPWTQQDEQQDHDWSNYLPPREKRSTWKSWFLKCISDNKAHNDTGNSPTFHHFKKITIRMNCVEDIQTPPKLIVEGIEFRPL